MENISGQKESPGITHQKLEVSKWFWKFSKIQDRLI